MRSTFPIVAFLVFLSLPIVAPAEGRSPALSPEQLYKAGVAAQKGDGVPQNTRLAMKYLTKSAKAGYARAQVWLAVINDRSRKISDQKRALKWAQMAAAQGHPVAECLVGAHYLSGVGVTKDSQKAEDWLTRAANQGQRDAMMDLAALSAQEIGSTPGAAWSYFWTKLAADRQLPYAVMTLGRLQVLPEDVKSLGEKRAKAFVPKLERPDLFNEDDLKVPNVLPPQAPAPSPNPSASPSPSPRATPKATPPAVKQKAG